MPDLNIVTFNTEGLSPPKAEFLADLNANILCLQETHKAGKPNNINGMTLAVYQPSPVHGSAIYVRDKSSIIKTSNWSENGMEILMVETKDFQIVSVYKQPPTPFNWPNHINITDKNTIVLGDFNSHNVIWGYKENNSDGEAVEEWALDQNLTILHSAKDQPSFNSARWKKGYNPDLIFVPSRLCNNFRKTVCDPIPKSQHRPVSLKSRPVVRALQSKPRVRFNFRRANWEAFTSELEGRIDEIQPDPDAYNQFKQLIWRVSRNNIPRGCRKFYIAGLSDNSKELYDTYTVAYEADPFSEETIALGEIVIASVSNDRKQRWEETVTTIDMTKNSKKAWSTIRKLNGDNNTQARLAAVTPNAVAHQLLMNGKPLNRERGYLKEMKEEMARVMEECDEEFQNFTMDELDTALKHLKAGKAAGLDDLCPEVIKHFGIKAKSWLIALFNTCATTYRIPKIWSKARVISLLKPKKDPNLATSYRPISLLSILYKLYERLILARITPTIDDLLDPDQAGFRPGKSCCGQVLNLTQYIEDGYEGKQITGTVFVDLTAAYDTVNHRLLLLKLAKTIKNSSIIKIIQSLLTNRRFFIELDGRRSRWRLQKNGLPQGSVLAPTLFNIYTNDQPHFENIRRFIYADDLCLATQAESLEAIERRLTNALSGLSDYYKANYLNANPGKTQVCAFHLKNYIARRKLEIVWEGKRLGSVDYPVYLGVTLDRTLSFNEHTRKLKAKIASRNNLINQLVTSKWGADPKTLRTSALALCYTTAEFCSPVWERSCHAAKVDTELNEACRIITGLLKPTPLQTVYRLAGIAPPSIRRRCQSRTQKHIQETDPRHPLHQYQECQRRLISRKSFMMKNSLHPTNAARSRLDQWKEHDDTAQ